MARKARIKGGQQDTAILLSGADPGDTLDIEPIYLAGRIPKYPVIIHNYRLDGEVGDFASESLDPVGPAADQCYKIVVENQAIDMTWNLNFQANPPRCVNLTSASIENVNGRGRAVVVVCCKKDDDGKCSDCATTVTITLSKGNQSVVQQARIFCVKN